MNCGFFHPNSRPSTTLIGASALRSRRTNPPPSKRRSCSKSLIDFSEPPEPYTSHQDRMISPSSVSSGTPPFVWWVLLLLPGGSFASCKWRGLLEGSQPNRNLQSYHSFMVPGRGNQLPQPSCKRNHKTANYSASLSGNHVCEGPDWIPQRTHVLPLRRDTFS